MNVIFVVENDLGSIVSELIQSLVRNRTLSRGSTRRRRRPISMEELRGERRLYALSPYRVLSRYV